MEEIVKMIVAALESLPERDRLRGGQAAIGAIVRLRVSKCELSRDELEGAIATTGTIAGAARLLGWSRRTMQSRMREAGMPPGKSGHPRKLTPAAESATVRE